MDTVVVKNLKKFYQVHQKPPGLKASFKSLFKRKLKTSRAVNNISFTIPQGELVGFIGPNGAGKTTTLKVLSGLLYPNSGEVKVLGFTPQDRKREFQKQFALVMGQKNQLWWDLPAQDSFEFYRQIYEVPTLQYKSTFNKLVKLLDVKSVLNTQVRKLSLGQRMKCELIASLLHNPKVLFLDEPTIGLDVVMQKIMRDFISSYNKQFEATIMLTSHYMEDVKQLAKRIIIIDKGKLLYDGSLEKVIDKYARNKIITVIFSQDPDQRKLAELGNIKSYEFPKAVINVKRDKVSQTASRLLKQFPVADLNIEEVPIEAIIREIFTNEKK